MSQGSRGNIPKMVRLRLLGALPRRASALQPGGEEHSKQSNVAEAFEMHLLRALAQCPRQCAAARHGNMIPGKPLARLLDPLQSQPFCTLQAAAAASSRPTIRRSSRTQPITGRRCFLLSVCL